MDNPVKEENIEEILKGKDIEGLLTLVKDDNMIVREKAVKILGETLDPRVVRPLIGLLRSDREWRVQRAAAEALERFGDQRAIEPLIEALKDKDKLVRQAAVKALSHETRAVDALIRLLDDKDRGVRLLVISLLTDIGDKKAVEPLTKALKDQDRNVRKRVVTALGKLVDDSSADPLIEALKDRDASVRGEAVRALGEIRSERMIGALLGRLGSDETDESVRDAAKDVLEKFREMAIRPLLNEMMEVTDGTKRDNIKDILGHLFNQFLRFEEELTKARKTVKKKKVVRKVPSTPEEKTGDAEEGKTGENFVPPSVKVKVEGIEEPTPDESPLPPSETMKSDHREKGAKTKIPREEPPISKKADGEAGGDVVAKLEKLAALKVKGLIDDGEFKKAKEKLLWS